MHCAISLGLVLQTAGQVKSYKRSHPATLAARPPLIAITTWQPPLSNFLGPNKNSVLQVTFRVVQVIPPLTTLAFAAPPCPGNPALQEDPGR